jgi:glycosyltransferase involved in cell wall biosynthesis
VDVGNLFRRAITKNCVSQKEKAAILAIMMKCMAPPLLHLSTSLQNALGSRGMEYNAVYLQIEPDAAEVWSFTPDIAATWPARLRQQGFPADIPLYVACSNCNAPTSEFKNVKTKELLLDKCDKEAQNTYTMYANRVDILALVDLHMIMHSTMFTGVATSAYSHVAVSLRLYANRTTNFCMIHVNPTPFVDSMDEFGLPSPDASCRPGLRDLEQKVEKRKWDTASFMIKYSLDGAKIKPTCFTTLTYIMQSPPKEALSLAYSFLKVPWGNFDKLMDAVRLQFADDPTSFRVIYFGLLHLRQRMDESAVRSPAGIHRPALKLQGSLNVTHVRPMKVLMVLHNSKVQGAPLVLFYYARMLATQMGMQVDFLVDPIGRGDLEIEIKACGMNVLEYKSLREVPVGRYDAIYGNTIVTWYHHNSLIPVYKKKLIMYCHESARDLVFRLYPSSPVVMNSANTVLYVTNRSMSVYRDIVHNRTFPGHKEFIIPNALPENAVSRSQMQSLEQDIRGRALNVPIDAVFYVTCGDVYENRNQLMFVKAALKLLGEGRNAYFMIVGFSSPSSAYRKAVKRAVQSSAFESRFRLLDKMPHKDSLSYMAAGDVYVSLASMESFGLTLVEAMTMALPVIVAKVDGVPDVIYEEAIDVDPLSIKSILSAMRSMMDPAVRADHSKLAVRHSTSFEQKFFFVRHLSVLREVIDNKRT